MKRFAFTILIVSLLDCGCAIQRTTKLTPLPGKGFTKLGSVIPSKTEKDVLEALLRFQVHQSFPKDTDAYQFDYIFVGFGDTDPDANFIHRFPDITRSVKPQSSASTTSEGVFDQKDAKRGILCVYQALKWNSDDEIEVESQIFIAGLAASGINYTLRLDCGRWSVIGRRLTWES